jgi:hypothetical protein
LPQVKGGMKDLETMTKKWLRLMREAAGMFSLRLLKRALSLPMVFSAGLIFFRATCSPAGTRPPTLVGSKVLSKFMIFNVNSVNCHFKNLAEKTRDWDIAAQSKEALCPKIFSWPR